MIAHYRDDQRDDRDARVWYKVDDHPAIRDKVLSRDQMFRAAHEGRVRCLWVSRRKLLVHRDALDDLARAGPPRSMP